MSDEELATYLPTNRLKRVADDVWIVDGPVIRFGMPWPKLPFPTRMTVLRLEDRLFIHSPTPLVPALRTEIVAIGRPCWIVAPSRLHYWWVPDWRRAFPDAEVYLAPRVSEQAGDHIDFEGASLIAESGYPWDDAIETLPVTGRFMTEVEFFHRPSRTLVLTDLIENFEPARLGHGLMRWLTWAAGAQDPNGGMPRDMRLTFSRKHGLRATVERMIAWDPERIIIAHGRWYETDGTAELKRAFRWLLS